MLGNYTVTNKINQTRHFIVSKIILLTPWCRVLLEKLTGLQLVKKFPAFHGTRRFITALTSIRNLSLSWASPIQSIHPHSSSWRSILILSTHLRLGKIILRTLSRYMFQPITRPSSGETNTKYAKDDHIKMEEVSLILLMKVASYSFTSISRTANKY